MAVNKTSIRYWQIFVSLVTCSWHKLAMLIYPETRDTISLIGSCSWQLCSTSLHIWLELAAVIVLLVVLI